MFCVVSVVIAVVAVVESVLVSSLYHVGAAVSRQSKSGGSNRSSRSGAVLVVAVVV